MALWPLRALGKAGLMAKSGSKPESREERLAKALRANLRRRKAQAQAQKQGRDEDPSPNESQSAGSETDTEKDKGSS